MAPVLLLDLDNTLAEREAAFSAWAHSKAERWAPNEPDAVAYLIEQDDDGLRPRREFFSLVRQRFELQDSVEALIAGYRTGLRDALPAVPGDVVERLHGLRAGGWKVAVVTNGDAQVQAQKIDHLGILGLLDVCCISGALGIRKPDPRIFEIAAARCGESLTGACVVGDGEADIIGAQRAGVQSIWLHRGRAWPRSDLRPDHIADNLHAALVLLDAAR